MVYVLSHTGKPLMPTQHYGKVKHLLRDGLAVVVRREPFTIQLCYDSKQFTQPVVLGVKTRLQRYDKVLWNGKTAFIFGSTSGRPVLRNIKGKLVTDKPSVNANVIKFLCRKHGSYIIQTI